MSHEQTLKQHPHNLRLDFFSPPTTVQVPVKNKHIVLVEAPTDPSLIDKNRNICTSDCDCACSIQS